MASLYVVFVRLRYEATRSVNTKKTRKDSNQWTYWEIRVKELALQVGDAWNEHDGSISTYLRSRRRCSVGGAGIHQCAPVPFSLGWRGAVVEPVSISIYLCYEYCCMLLFCTYGSGIAMRKICNDACICESTKRQESFVASVVSTLWHSEWRESAVSILKSVYTQTPFILCSYLGTFLQIPRVQYRSSIFPTNHSHKTKYSYSTLFIQ